MSLNEVNEKHTKTESDIDKTGIDSFPASDAPALNYPGANLPLQSAERSSSDVSPEDVKEDKSQLIADLNKILEQEHACAIRYATHAAVVNGPYSETVAIRLKEIAQDEINHAEKLRERIVNLGGRPSMALCSDDLKYADTLDEIIKINIEEEFEAIQAYEKIFRSISPENVILYQTLQELIRDEQEHVEQLQNLLPQS